MKARRFVNVVTGYSLGRINLKNILFYPSTTQALQQAAAMAAANEKKMKEDKQATTTLQDEDYDELSFMPSHRQSYMDLKFLPFYGTRGGEGMVLCVDESGLATLYDADTSTVQLMPGLGMPQRCHPVSYSVTHNDAADPARPDALYVMDSQGGSFQALVYGGPIQPSGRLLMSGDRYGWHWRTLPTPLIEDAESDCYALLHGQEDAGARATICVSFSLIDRGCGSSGPAAAGTYCFDTASLEWTKAGDWTLPFCSRAYHAPELGDGLLFGLESDEPNRFCVMDISDIKMNRAPMLRHAWLEHAEPPPEWRLNADNLVYLRAGRFCIHRSFNIMVECGYGDWKINDRVVVLLTGMEVVRAPGASKLRMVKHKSKFLNCNIQYLL